MSGSGRYNRRVIVLFAEGDDFRMEDFEVSWLVFYIVRVIANVHITINICVIFREFLLVLLLYQRYSIYY